MITKSCGCSTATCGCCEGTQALTPAPVFNRPGLSALRYHVGTHGTFFETMKARLASMTVDAPGADGQTIETFQPLRGLSTRDASDPAIALLDSWATVGDVLTFYQERIANEGYLRTATERRSILELARLVGYALRPGVAATVYLAYTLDDNQTVPVDIPIGARSQSIPGPGELPQSFETSDLLTARADWNDLEPRMTQPQRITSPNGTDLNTDTIYFLGTATNLKPNDPLLFDVAKSSSARILRHVKTVDADFTNNRTKVTLQESPAQTAAPSSLARATLGSTAAIASRFKAAVSTTAETQPARTAVTAFDALIQPLSLPPSLQPSASAFLQRKIGDTLDQQRDTLPQVLTAFKPEIASAIYPAWVNAAVTAPQGVQIYAFRVKASPFGSTAPLKPVTDDQGKVVGSEEWPIAGTETIKVDLTFGRILGALKVAVLSSLQALITVTYGGDTVSAQTPVENNTVVSLNGVDVGIEVHADNHGQISQLRFTFRRLGKDRVIDILPRPAESSFAVRIDEESPRKVTQGQTLRYSISGRKVAIESSQRSFSVSDQSPSAPNPLDVVFLDTQYDQIVPDSWAAIIRPDPEDPHDPVWAVTAVRAISKADYGLTGKSTQLTLERPWLTNHDRFLSVLRGTTVFAQSEELQLAEQPYKPDTAGDPDDVRGDTIELARLYDGLQSGRWIIVSGERTDVKNASGVAVTGITASELVMLAGVKQSYDPTLPGDKVHSTLILANDLAYTYKRNTVTIYGNVVKATHGETRNEPLGSGDGSQALQSFVLKQPPLTFVPAPTPAGVDSTLKVYVNDVEWHETDTLAGLGAKDRKFVTKTDDADKMTVIFGNGDEGARLPTGMENVKAVYRNGIGKPGNVAAQQISLLQTRPLGVKSVINPLRASGGADREGRDLARENAPLAVMSLDRLVSLQDYADFTRTFAGVGKATSRRLSDGRREVVHITIAGADDIPIDPVSDLYRNLVLALRQFGDPALPVQVDPRELVVLLLSAKIRLAPDYQWDSVAQKIRDAVLETFGFQKRALGQPVLLSEVISLLQNTDGVAYVDVDAFGGIPEKTADPDGTRRLLTLDELALTVEKVVYASLLFTVCSFRDVSGLVTKLRAHPSSDQASLFLWNQFSAPTQQLLTDVTSTTQQQQAALVIEFNKILLGESIYDAQRFPAATSSPEILDLLARDPKGGDLIRLNRRLLESAYTAEIVTSQESAPSPPAQRVDVNLADFEQGALRPAQLAIFTSAVPDTVILNQIK